MFRKALRADLKALSEIEDLAFPGDKLSQRSLLYMINNPRAQMRVMAQEGALMGYGLLLYRKNSDAARLYSFAVHPDFQGQGLARLLMADLETVCLKHKIYLEVRGDNLAAISLYKKLHFEVTGERDNYYEDGEAALMMRKTL